MHDGPVDLLWTGGWDSSYRLLSLLLDLRLPVQPIYLYDDKRVSAPVEVQTMQRLRERLAEEWRREAGERTPDAQLIFAELGLDGETAIRTSLLESEAFRALLEEPELARAA